MNPFVDYINSLRTQSEDTDPNFVEENRAESLARLRKAASWFPSDEALRVRTRVSVLVEAMRRADFPADLVFLTGDAGDGKTAACVDLAAAEGVRRPLQVEDSAGAWTIIKDASEIPEQQLLAAIHRSLTERSRLVVAINEGRLRRLQKKHELSALWSTVFNPSLTSLTEEDEANVLDAAIRSTRVAVINFRHRMHVRPVTPALLEIWTREGFWERTGCSNCPVRERCPILANVQSLRSKTVVSRMTDALVLAHYAGQRLPFRRLQGVLAHAVTAGLKCKQVIDGRPPQLVDRYYWVFLQRERSGDLRPEPVARALAPIDSAYRADPERDEHVSSLIRTQDALEPFDRLVLAASPHRESADNLRALRRRLTFDQSGVGEPLSEAWREALRLVESAAAGDDSRALAVLAHGINRLHRLDTTLSNRITAHQLEPAAFRDPERASLELDVGTEFEFRMVRGPRLAPIVQDWLESSASDLELHAWPHNKSAPSRPARLRVDARLMLAMLDVQDGYNFIPAVGSHRRELARFHAQLLEQVEQKDIHVIVRSNGRSWRLTRSENQLRFEGRS